MLFDGVYYQEIAVLGEDKQTAMKLIRSENGNTLLCKRIDTSLGVFSVKNLGRKDA